MLIIYLAFLHYLFNNSLQNDKIYIIRNLLNNNAYNAIYVDYRDVKSESLVTLICGQWVDKVDRFKPIMIIIYILDFNTLNYMFRAKKTWTFDILYKSVHFLLTIFTVAKI